MCAGRAHLCTRHHSVVLEQEALLGALKQAVRYRGFPGMADIDSSLLLFAREIVRWAPNVVSGECGDEVFGGYPWFRGAPALPEDSFPWSGSIALRESVLRVKAREKLGLKRYVHEALHRSLDGYDVSCVQGEGERALFKLQRLCFDYFMTNLQERALCMCAPQGLQVLTPLCDDRLVEYVYSVPWEMKRMGGRGEGPLPRGGARPAAGKAAHAAKEPLSQDLQRGLHLPPFAARCARSALTGARR